MIAIDKITLRFPAELKYRSKDISNLLIEQLKNLRQEKDISIDHLKLPPVSIRQDANNNEIASDIFNSIKRQLGGYYP